jgi:aspartate-semialdehyde dehydrogenase
LDGFIAFGGIDRNASMECPMKALVAAMLLAALTVPAYSQAMSGGGKRHGAAHQQGTKPQAPKVDEKAYRAALDRLPDKQFDPWQSMRGSATGAGAQNPK